MGMLALGDGGVDLSAGRDPSISALFITAMRDGSPLAWCLVCSIAIIAAQHCVDVIYWVTGSWRAVQRRYNRNTMTIIMLCLIRVCVAMASGAQACVAMASGAQAYNASHVVVYNAAIFTVVFVPYGLRALRAFYRCSSRTTVMLVAIWVCVAIAHVAQADKASAATPLEAETTAAALWTCQLVLLPWETPALCSRR